MITINMISTMPQSFHYWFHVGMISNSSALHFWLKNKFFLINNKFKARECLMTQASISVTYRFYGHKFYQNVCGKFVRSAGDQWELVNVSQFRRKHTIYFRIFSALHHIPGRFYPVCELVLLQPTLDKAMVHLIHYIWVKKDQLKK